MDSRTPSPHSPLVSVRGLRMHFPGPRKGAWPWQGRLTVKADDGVDLDIPAGATLGLVGESGCGKSTLARAVLQLYRPTAGEVLFEGQDLCKLKDRELRPIRRRLQIIFQDPCASLDSRRSIGYQIAEPLMLHGMNDARQRRERVSELLQLVGLSPAVENRYPHEFSGGQRQRVGVARSLATNLAFVIADEPVSALDVSIQAQVINLLRSLQERLGLTYLFISHDLRVVRYLSDYVAVMYLGRIAEIAPTERLYASPVHPYTQALLSAVPRARWETTGVQRIQLKEGWDMLHIHAEDRVYDLHRPDGCTVLCIEAEMWPGNEFGLWLPECVFLNYPDERLWGNWMPGSFQAWRTVDRGLCWTREFAPLTITSMLTVDAEHVCVWYTHRLTNTSSYTLSGVNTQTCFHLVNAPRFISIRGERLWACLDRTRTTTDSVPRRESPDPRRVVFLREGVRDERTVVSLPGFPRAIMPQAASSALFIAEALDGRGAVGIASSHCQRLFHNNDPILRCIHSEPFPIAGLAPGDTAEQEGLIMFSEGDHQDVIDRYRELVSEKRGWS